MANNINIYKTLKTILDNIPKDWVELTTHRLDIYDESLAKTQFLERLAACVDQGKLSTESLEELPTAFDYVRLGHQLSSLLEWAIAHINNLSPNQVISFASHTMPLMAVLRSNALASRETHIYYDGETPPPLDEVLLSKVYEYRYQLHKISDASEISLHPKGTVVLLTSKPLKTPLSSISQVDISINSHSCYGSIFMIHSSQRLSSNLISQWVSEVQHVRRRETIAVTPAYALSLIKEIVGIPAPAPEPATKEEIETIYSSVRDNTGSPIKPVIASSGLSVQYSILMGLIHYALDEYPCKSIKLVIPPNCYGGTNDQARRIAATLPHVEVVDLPVDGHQEMTTSLEKVLTTLAENDAVPLALVEIPTNPRVEVPDLTQLSAVLKKPRLTKDGKEAIKPIFIVDQTFCPNVHLLDDNSPLAQVQTLSFVSGSKFPSGGRCTAGYCTANSSGAATMPYIDTHLNLCQNQANSLQLKILAENMPSMPSRIKKAFDNTERFVGFVKETLPNASISFISTELIHQGFTPSVFSLDLPSKGETPEAREEHKRNLNLKMINYMIKEFPEGSKHCVSYGQLQKCYWTVPATSTQGTTKESDKDYIVRIALPPEIDMDRLLKCFDTFCQQEGLAKI